MQNGSQSPVGELRSDLDVTASLDSQGLTAYLSKTLLLGATYAVRRECRGDHL